MEDDWQELNEVMHKNEDVDQTISVCRWRYHKLPTNNPHFSENQHFKEWAF